MHLALFLLPPDAFFLSLLLLVALAISEFFPFQSFRVLTSMRLLQLIVLFSLIEVGVLRSLVDRGASFQLLLVASSLIHLSVGAQLHFLVYSTQIVY